MQSESVREGAARVLEKHAKSFRWAAAFLAPQARSDAAVVYAFCRYIDDVVDEADDVADARLALDETVAMLEGATEPSPLVEEFLHVSRRTGFGIEPALDLIKGVRSDLGVVRVADDQELSVYCYRVAGTVGLMMCRVLGVKSQRAERYAIDLGVGMQLTNICRDVLEDAQIGRIYLPLTRLDAVGLTPEALVSHATLPGEHGALTRTRVAAVVRDLLTTADAKYLSARSGYEYLPPRARLSIMVAAELYQHIGHVLRDVHGCDPLGGRVSVSPAQKARLTARVIVTWALDCSKRATRTFEGASRAFSEAL